MAKLPVLKPQEVVARLAALGFVEVRQCLHGRAWSGSGSLRGVRMRSKIRYFVEPPESKPEERRFDA